jgi:hypothetical protein
MSVNYAGSGYKSIQNEIRSWELGAGSLKERRKG